MAVNQGYSGTPLGKKLGIKSGFNARLVDAPVYYHSLFDDMPADVKFNNDSKIFQDFIHFFVQKESISIEGIAKAERTAQTKRHDLGIVAQEIIESYYRYFGGHHQELWFGNWIG